MGRGWGAAIALAVACGRPAAPPPSAVEPSAVERQPSAVDRQPSALAPSSVAPPPGVPIVAVHDRAALAAIAADGGALDDVLGPGGRAAIAAVVGREVAALAAGDREAGVGIRGHAHRLFDVGWLAPGGARFELVGVVFRIDRLAATPATCGDVRLLYRLAYGDAATGSRLPMTVAVVLRGEARDAGGGCAAAAARWRVPTDAAAGAALGAALIAPGGPLARARRGSDAVVQVLLDLQAVRWPSAVQPSLGGHAAYLLLALEPSAEGLRPAPLLMTPDVDAIAADPAKRRALAAWLATPATVDALDAGGAELPPALRARRSIAVTPGGFARPANRPFARLLDAAALAGLSLAGRRTIASPAALLHRLDEQTCAGCHQQRALAGFHWLGDDPPDAPAAAALAVGRSPHMIEEEGRRAAVLAAVLEGRAPELARPPTARGTDRAGDLGAPCGLGDPGFAAWTCADGLRCDPHDAPPGAPLGVCVGAAPTIGDRCDVGPIAPGREAGRDAMPRARRHACPPATRCVRRGRGFPAGMCMAPSCTGLPDGAVCGAIASSGFDRCLVAGGGARCLGKASAVGLRGCADDRPCRDDYLCARTPDGAGGCVPPYFLFQLRVDGHPPAGAD